MKVNKTHKKAWPTKKAMTQVYELQLWGKSDAKFYSGEGSHHPEIVQPYLEVVSKFLKSFKLQLTVCDLGCGDFNIGKQLLPFCKTYIAVDIVEDLICHLQKTFKNPQLEFLNLDISKDELPKADVLIIRQVLQHLSNDEIYEITKKLSNYKYAIVTEHLPEGIFTPNKNIISGQGIRLKKGSGVNLQEAPFNLKARDAKELLRVNSKQFKDVIVTTLYTMF